MTSQQRAYLAGLLDSDGSLMLQLKPREAMRYKFRVKTSVVFYQHSKNFESMNKLRQIIGMGYIHQRNDCMSEIRIEGFAQVSKLLKQLQKYIFFKKKQLCLMLEAIALAKKKNYQLDTF